MTIRWNIIIICLCMLFVSVTAFAQQQENAESAGNAGVKGKLGAGTVAPGQMGTVPGQAETLPGQMGTVPGQTGTVPGQPQSAGKEKTVQMTDIHDIKPPEDIGVDLTILYYILLSILIMGILAAIFLYFRKRKKRIKEKKFVTLSPDEAAYASLDEMTDVESLEGKEFYFRLSAILRNYIEGRYGINAPEMTTEEFIPRIEELGIGKELRKSLRELLHATDPIKFAGVYAIESQMKKRPRLCEKFCETNDAGDNIPCKPEIVIGVHIDRRFFDNLLNNQG